jgi:hypothetical protein
LHFIEAVLLGLPVQLRRTLLLLFGAASRRELFGPLAFGLGLLAFLLGAPLRGFLGNALAFGRGSGLLAFLLRAPRGFLSDPLAFGLSGRLLATSMRPSGWRWPRSYGRLWAIAAPFWAKGAQARCAAARWKSS